MELLKGFKAVGAAFAEYFGKRRTRKRQAVADSVALETFLETRASHVAQTSLYGYIRTRAGSRFPELFENDDFVEAINIAKWQMWAACLSDLSVYAGGCLIRTASGDTAPVAKVISESVARVLERTGVPEDSGPEFEASCAKIASRISTTEWHEVPDGEGVFTESPDALVYWAPIVDELKELDSAIVLNSVRFRWQEVRRDLRETLDADALLASLRTRSE